MTTSRIPRAPRRAGPSTIARVINGALTLFVIGFLIVMLILVWPMFRARLAGVDLPAQPTPAPTSAPHSVPQPRTAPASVPVQQSIDAYNATATAQYQEAISAPVENVGQSMPAEIDSKPAPDRQPAGENVPTAGPVVQTESDNQTGSKPVLTNPQETHQCRHGQKWVDEKGCKNP